VFIHCLTQPFPHSLVHPNLPVCLILIPIKSFFSTAITLRPHSFRNIFLISLFIHPLIHSRNHPQAMSTRSCVHPLIHFSIALPSHSLIRLLYPPRVCVNLTNNSPSICRHSFTNTFYSLAHLFTLSFPAYNETLVCLPTQTFPPVCLFSHSFHSLYWLKELRGSALTHDRCLLRLLHQKITLPQNSRHRCGQPLRNLRLRTSQVPWMSSGQNDKNNQNQKSNPQRRSIG
jgi:hypothetical protein